MKTTLIKLTTHDLRAVQHLTLPPDQEAFAGGSLPILFERLALSDVTDDIHLFATATGRVVVGFFILKEGLARPGWAAPESVTLHNLRVGSTYHGQGYGRASLLEAARWIRDNRPAVQVLALGVNERNITAIGLYLSAGFSDTGKVHVGRLGPQKILAARIVDLLY